MVDLEVAKIRLLCEWIVKAMEPRESNLQSMLRYMLAGSIHNKGRVGLVWIGFLINPILGTLVLRFGAH